jgi:transcriptional regulator with XRE-family HTH domain
MSELSEGYIIQIEGGFKSLSVHSLFRVAGALKVSIDCLIYGESRPSSFGNINLLLSSVSDNKLEKTEELLYLVVDGFCLEN